MSTQAIPAPCPILDTDLSVERKALFDDLDKRAREIDKIWSEIWIEMADICIAIDEGNLWRESDYTSYNDWLLKACPRSRSWAYMATGARKELRDIPDEELRQIPLGNAVVLKDVPKQDRKGRKILDAAQSKPPREFLPIAIQESPNAHLETFVSTKYNFQCSQLKVVEAALEMYRMLHPEGDFSDEGIFESWASEYMLTNQAAWERIR